MASKLTESFKTFVQKLLGVSTDIPGNSLADVIDYAAENYSPESASIEDSSITAKKLAATAKTQVLSYQIEDLAAGADIAARTILEAPAGIDLTLVSAHILPQGSAAGIDDSNTCVIALTDGAGNSIVSKTYNSGTALPAAGVAGDLGALSSTYKVLSAGEKLSLSLTNGATANTPGIMLQVVFTVAEAV